MYNWSFVEDLWKTHHYSLTMSTTVSPQAQGKLGYPSSRVTVYGFLADQIGFRFGSKYMEMGLGLANQLGGWLQAAESLLSVSDQAASFINGIKEKLNVTGGVSTLTVYNTIKFWSGYEPFSMTLNLIFIILDRKSYQIYKDNFKYLTDAVFPLPSNEASQGILMSAPLGYLPLPVDQVRNKGVHPNGTWTVAIGKWFLASGFLVTNVNYNFSRQTVQLSKSEGDMSVPIMVEATVELEPWRILFADEIRDFFKFQQSSWGWDS